MPRPGPALEREFDLSIPVEWDGEPPASADVEAVERAVRDAVRRAVERFRAGGVRGLPAGEGAGGERAGGPSGTAAERAYAVPSYDDDGEPVEVPVVEGEGEPPDLEGEEDELTGSGEGTEGEAPREALSEEGAEKGFEEGAGARAGRREVVRPEVHEGASPFEGRQVVILPRWRAVSVQSDRYAVTGSLARALAWGERLFGGRSYVVLQGPLHGPRSGDRFYAVATDEIVRNEDFRLQPFRTIEGVETVVAGGTTFWQGALEARDGGMYRLRVLSSVEGGQFFPPEEELFRKFVRELRETPREELAFDREAARRAVFGRIDRLLAEGRRREARERLVDLDASAFVLVDWETKVRYLELLLEGSPGERDEEAILQIFTAVAEGGRRSELEAVIELLERRGLYGELFDDMDRVWSLLVLVGRRFGVGRPLTAERLYQFLQDAELLPGPAELAARGVLGPSGMLVTSDLVAEVEEAARGFIRFLGGALEAVAMLLTEPDRVVEGVAQLVRLVIAAELAQRGHRPSQELIAELARSAGRQVMAGLEGAEILRLQARVMRRIKWAAIWEIASLFVGVGEVQAVLGAAGLSRRVLALGRIGGILGLAGRSAGASRTLRNVERLAAALARSRPSVGSADEVANLLSHLPEDEVRRLGRALEGAEIDEGADLAAVAASSPELRQAVDRIADHVDALHALGRRAGGLTEEVAETYATLSRTFGIEPRAIEGIARALPEGQAGRFLAVVRSLPAPVPGLRGAPGAEFLETIAASRRRLDAVLDNGPGLVLALHRTSGGRPALLDDYLEALARLRDDLPVETRASEYRRLLTRLETGDAGAWIRLEARRRRVAGEPSIEGLDAAVRGDFLAETGVRRLLQGRHDAILDELVEDMLAEHPEELRRTLGRIGSLADEEVRGLAVVQRVGDELPGPHGWLDVLDLDRGHRSELLELVARLEPSLADETGLARLLGRGLTPPRTNVQGTLGHLWAVRTLQRRYPGARIELEVDAPGREIDVRVETGGRTLDVEVKTGLGGTPPISRRQIRQDLIRHLGDRFENLLYLYHPDQAGSLQRVEAAMLNALDHPEVRRALRRAGIAPSTAAGWLRLRIAAGLVDTYAF